MAAETIGAAAVRSSNPADSYIGSLISLTSKSEIRYEGVLYNINTDESSIGLKNVRSFGTEGRKKDGPQIPPSDKVYEYILFRGSDIKDLQVKSSPPVQPAPPPASINNDPAIIQQSHYPRPATAPTSLPTVGSGVSSLSDVGSHNVQMGLTGSNYQGGLPFYQPGGNLGTWGAASPAPPPNGNGSGMAMPMYWPGYYGPSTGLPHLHQQSMLRPPLGVSMPPPPMQPPMQLPNYSVPFPSGASNLPSSNLPSSNLPGSNLLTPNWPGSNLPVPNLATSLPDMPSLVPSSTGSLNFVSTSSSPVTLVPPIASDTLPSLMPNKASRSAPPAANLTTPLPTLSPLTTSTTELSAITPPIHSNPSATSGPAMPNQATGQSISSIPIASSSLRTETPTHTLVTLGQLVQSGPATVSSSQSVQAVHKDVEVVQVSSSSPPEPLITVSAEAQPPILPLPAPSRPAYKPNGAPYYNRHGYRGHERGRGTGSSRPVAKFTEDFDFEAMNEKFNKDEVWGHLGKSKHARDKEDGNVSDDDSHDEYDDEDAKVDSKAVYNKDDFFDTLSCNTLGNNPQNGRPRFSEQIKLDTETFGEFSRYRGGRGGRGPPRGGRSRGSYHGRGYGSGNNGYGNGSGNNGYGNGSGNNGYGNGSGNNGYGNGSGNNGYGNGSGNNGYGNGSGNNGYGYGSGNGYTGRGRGRAMPSRAA